MLVHLTIVLLLSVNTVVFIVFVNIVVIVIVIVIAAVVVGVGVLGCALRTDTWTHSSPFHLRKNSPGSLNIIPEQLLLCLLLLLSLVLLFCYC